MYTLHIGALRHSLRIAHPALKNTHPFQYKIISTMLAHAPIPYVEL